MTYKNIYRNLLALRKCLGFSLVAGLPGKRAAALRFDNDEMRPSIARG